MRTFKALLTIYILQLSFVTLIFAFFVNMYFHYLSLKNDAKNQLVSVSAIISDNLTSSLAFNDEDDAAEVLVSLQQIPSIAIACIYTESKVFLQYQSNEYPDFNCPDKTSNDTVVSSISKIEVTKEILHDGIKLGYTYIGMSLDSVYSRLARLMFFSLFLIITALMLTYILLSKVQGSITNPIIELAHFVQSFSATGRLKSSFKHPPNTIEIKTLRDRFIAMVQRIQERETQILSLNSELETKVEERTRELQEVQNTLVNQAHQAGMAEVATGVLHNVGNVLNSVNISANKILEISNDLRIAQLKKASDLINENLTQVDKFFLESEKGKRIPEYLSKISTQMTGQKERMDLELRRLIKNIEHIKEIVSVQQTFARSGGVNEPEDLVLLVEDALEIHSQSLKKYSITVVTDFDDIPKVKLDRRKFLQILINLISNAKHAMVDKGDGERVLTISIMSLDSNLYRISVKDTGMGISPNNLEKIFQHGFTTKKHGHGFGLHSSAIAAQELGGQLYAKSSGKGKGAEFVLEIPK